jgi:hypothetical protein
MITGMFEILVCDFLIEEAVNEDFRGRGRPLMQALG